MFILIIEDEKAISDVVAAYLEKEGYKTEVARDGERAVEMFEDAREDGKPHDLIILDLMLPRVSGEDVCRAVRKVSQVPIIMLTARGSEADVIAGLDLGADDYVVKPFSPRVLMARVRANLRESASPKEIGAALRVGDLEIDMSAFEIRRGGEVLGVTRNEFLVFSTLASKPEKTFSRDDLISAAFGEDYEGFDRTIDTYIKNLRRKLCNNAHPHGYIRTIHGFGYRVDSGKNEKK